MLLIVRILRDIISIMPSDLTSETLEAALRLLSGRLDLAQTEPVGLVVCGGSALIAMGLIERATQDVDVVALMNPDRSLRSPVPFPDFLLKAAREVARDLGLAEDWLNNGPSRDEGGLFQLGLPSGIGERLGERPYGPRLSVYFVGRLDQIHFKLYAATDRGGVHVDDLLALIPTAAELEQAARWAMTHDVSEAFRMVLKDLLRQLDYESVADRI